MNEKRANRFTIGRWTKATFGGWITGVVLILMLSSFLDSIGIENVQFYIGTGMGAGVAFTQWLVLRKFVPVGSKWHWFSILGMSIPFIFLDLLPAGTVPYKLPLSIAIGSMAVGLLQYILLKKQLEKAYLWFFGCFFAWTLAAFTVKIIDYTMNLQGIIASNLVLALINLLLILSGGVVLGVISGIAMKNVLA